MAGLCDIYLAVPRGFCAGVKRAISLVEKALEDYGAPVYVRHEIVHNRHVVENLRQRGVVFIEDFDEIKDDSRPVILSAHGVPKAVETEAARRKLTVIDATCPLVAKVHRQIRKLAGYFAACEARQVQPVLPPETTALGAMLKHLRDDTNIDDFQPMNINFGIFPTIQGETTKNGKFRKIKGMERKEAYCRRALADIENWIAQI